MLGSKFDALALETVCISVFLSIRFIFQFGLATSRSTSPSSRLYSMSTLRQTGTIPKKTPVIPRSLVNSRETSPTRNGMHQTVRRLGYPRRPERPPIIPSRPVLAQKMLQQSREAETALADALVIL